MPTQLGKFQDAYAMMTVAVYEPLILRWVSRLGLHLLAARLAPRLGRASAIRLDGRTPTGLALSRTLRRPLPREIPEAKLGAERGEVAVDARGRAVGAGTLRRVEIDGFPNAVAVGSTIYLYGITHLDPGYVLARRGEGAAGLLASLAAKASGFAPRLKAVPTALSGAAPLRNEEMDLFATRARLEEGMLRAAANWVSSSGVTLAQTLSDSALLDSIRLPHLWPGAFAEEALSPIGIAHYYRQHYFNEEEGVGPIEEAFTIAPLENLEVIYQVTNRQVHEEVLEQGLETVSEEAVEEKNLDEVSDKVSSMIQQDFSASMSASTSGGIGVWSASASASVNFGNSSERGRETASRRLKDVTKRASERITKSVTIKTRNLEEVTRTNTTRRVIRNDADHPVSYGLRRVLRRVRVKVQELGPRLVWQLYVRSPGDGLARSEFVHFRESDPISVPEVPPGVPPYPRGGVDSGSTQALVEHGPQADDTKKHAWFVTIAIQPGPGRQVTAVRIDSVADLDPVEDNPAPPTPRNDADFGSTFDPETGVFTARIGVWPGTASALTVSFTYTWEPTQTALDEWEAQRKAAVDKITEDLLIQQFERQKSLITERSKIKPRPANDLRKEERWEVINRMVSYLLGSGAEASEATPLEMESFQRYFEPDGAFLYNFPWWWQPRWASTSHAFPRPSYQVTAESEPAPMGSSLGWMIQLDGDRRRNEFLNSPWVRVCMPLRPGREREALEWLAKHLEGDVGFSTTSGPVAALLAEIETRRAQEAGLGISGPDYVTVASTPGAPADPLTPEGVYPIVDEFSVTVPTDGFVYDELVVSI
jgi:hypothetical protein